MAAVAATGPGLPAPAATAGTTAPAAAEEDPQTTGGRQRHLQSKLRSWNQPQTTLRSRPLSTQFSKHAPFDLS